MLTAKIFSFMGKVLLEREEFCLSSLEDAPKNWKDACKDVERNSVTTLASSRRTSHCSLQLRNPDDQASCPRASMHLSLAREAILADGN
jgi:hypothetical protein